MKQMSKCISVQILHYGKSVLGHNILLCKELHGNKSLLIINLPRNHNLCEKEDKLLVFYCHLWSLQ